MNPRCLGMFLGGLALAGCAEDEITLTVYMSGVPSTATYLQPAIGLGGRLSYPLNRTSLFIDPTDVGIKLQLLREDARGVAGVAVRALDASGCTLGAGDGGIELDQVNRQLALVMEPVRQSRDCERELMIFEVRPPVLKLGQDEGQKIRIYGWPLPPDAVLELGGKRPLQMVWRTPLVLEVVPDLQGAAFGMVPITLTAPKGATVTHNDLLRYY